MKVSLNIPRLGESIAEVTIAKLLVASEAHVAKDAEVVEVETAKLNQVLYAPEAGKITFHAKVGDTVKVGASIATIDTESVATIAEPMPMPTLVPEITPQPMPAPPPPLEHPISHHPKEVRHKLSAIRKTIAERLVQAQHEMAMLTTFNEVDMSHIVQIREKYKEIFQSTHGIKLGFMSFFLKASAAALKAFPQINAYLDGDDLVYRNYVDISIAVSAENKLFVPVLRSVDTLSFADIEKEIDLFSEKAKTGGMKVEDLAGGSFTITNGGIFGSLLSTPIINPPQCAILGMHKIEKRPVVVNDQIVIRPMMYLALSYDHRIIDGKDAILFLMHIKNHLEDPERLQLDI